MRAFILSLALVFSSTSVLAAEPPSAEQMVEMQEKVDKLEERIDDLEETKQRLLQFAALVVGVSGFMGWELKKTIRNAPRIAKAMAKKSIVEQLGQVAGQLAQAAELVEIDRKIHDCDIVLISPDGQRDVQIDLLNHGFKKVRVAKILDPTEEKGDLVVMDLSRLDAGPAAVLAETWLESTHRTRLVLYFPTSKGQLTFKNRNLFADKARPANNFDTLYMHVKNSLERMVSFNEIL